MSLFEHKALSGKQCSPPQESFESSLGKTEVWLADYFDLSMPRGSSCPVSGSGDD